MIDLKTWQPTASIEGAAATGILPADAFVVIWNPCDGHHLWDLSKYPADKIAADAREGFGTHWCLMPDGPDVAPGDWHAMDTLEDAYESDRIPFAGSVLLWSPTGAHHLPWLLVERPSRLEAEGRQGIYTAWRLLPDRPAE